ncbi:MAG: hypothetical protein J5833_04865 [Victivallales bacterium]|nr:hypothetical protein [Victivallales bacterium]
MLTFKPVPFYYIDTTEPSDLSPSAAAEAMRRVREAGYGGIVFFNKPPTGFDAKGYLSEAWFDAVGNFLLAAEAEGLEFWVNDGHDYPPGDAAGRILAENPNLCQLRLALQKDGTVAPVEVPWGYPAFEEPESSRLFIKFTYEEYWKRFKEHFGKGLTGFFSDADNRRFNHHVRKLMNGVPYFPWSRNFATEFSRLCGYDIIPRLRELWDGTDHDLCKDYWLVAGMLYQRWFRNNYEWCHDHGVKYSFHTSDTGAFSREECDRSSVFTEGLPLELFKYSDLPGTDHELPSLDGGTHYDRRLRNYVVTIGHREPEQIDPDFAKTAPDLRAKYAGSAAFIFRKQRALCESYAACGWDSSPTRLRRIAAWQIMQGINFFVPQAVSHRFFDEVKYHAPPEFLTGGWQHTLPEFNGFLEKYSRLATEGTLVAPIGVIDTSSEIMAGRTDGASLHNLCDRLNRQSLGYVITDKEHAPQFQYILNPLDATIKLPEPDATFDGGDLLWMHRRLDDGTEYLLVASVWSDSTLTGTLKWRDKEYSLELATGEIAVIGGPWEEYRSPQPPRKAVTLSSASVRRLGDNIVPLRCLSGWTIESPVSTLFLMVPEYMEGKVICDGVLLKGGEKAKEFDDPYRRYPVSTALGEHRISFAEETEAMASNDWLQPGTSSETMVTPDSQKRFMTPLLLRGDFAAKVTAGPATDKVAGLYYHRIVMKPESLSVTLGTPAELTLGDWTKQGLPFYDGAVEYDFDIDGDYHDAVIEVPNTWYCKVALDGKSVGAILWAPWRLSLGDLKGKHKITVTLWNSLAGRMDGYLRENGLIEPPRLLI